MNGISDKTVKANYGANKYRFNGKELQNQEFSDGNGLEEIDFGARMQDPQLGVWHNIDQSAEKDYSVSPYAYTLNNPTNRVEIDGRWSVTQHYYLTNFALAEYGITGLQAGLLSHYASVYSDHPSETVLRLNNFVHSQTGPMLYYTAIDYSKTANSQITSWAPGSTSFNYNIWHSMRSPEEAEAYEKDMPGGISAKDAMLRGQEFGWSQIFASAEQGKLADLKSNSLGIQEFGQGVHALQDSYAHKGADINHHDANNDVFPKPEDYQNALTITQTAINVHSLLSGDYKRVKTDQNGSVKLEDIGGMNKQQITRLFQAINQYLSR